ncbi:hypothetical protein [Tenuibacillus multivorans]|uniref:Uncharacterized protein n=1 Tax=Tenuibacillus multivorans TaxID=237069 RepID=A0A1G9WED2_9BACI|nr:hypothetical protein [Tenuibacillus multivorans]GEL76424.1 hypothetical protein TMU01_06590 [Tenuibacillus multivorans]SDM82859.1 hypothetical protein SAMN05216498_0713 [Tenuibacillus multivorans]
MKREIRLSEKLLLSGLSFILLFMIVQDWVSLGPLNDIQAISEEQTVGELVTVTLIGVSQILLIMGFVIFFMGKRYPIWVKLWLVIHQSSIFVGALFAWWIPYLTGYGAEGRVERYERMFGDTHSFLPEMNGLVPNTLHTIFHVTLLFCILMTVYIFITEKRNRKHIEVSQVS